MPLDSKILALCKPSLDYLKNLWEPGTGIAQASGYTPKDSDDTSLTYETLRRFNYDLDIEAVLHYEEEECFRCFALEANPSISANIHVLGALRHAGFSIHHPSVQKTLNFLRRSQTLRLFWFDKWHASPYYATAHAIIACAKYCDDLVQDAVYWLLKTQNPDGSWGYYPTPTAEETAHCIQALCIWRQSGNPIPDDAIQRGAAWLQAHAEPPYPPLWIGKCLYSPELVVRSTIMSALLLAAQNV
jgi:halimadienyl-diphosphate synthase